MGEDILATFLVQVINNPTPGYITLSCHIYCYQITHSCNFPLSTKKHPKDSKVQKC